MKVFFDNCTSPVLATTLHGYLSASSDEAWHIKDLKCGRHAKDDEWIAMLGEDRAEWIVITGDGRIHKNRPLREAFRAAGLLGFVLAPAYQKTPMNQVASILLWRWPELRTLASLVDRPALYSLPIRRTSKPKQLPI